MAVVGWNDIPDEVFAKFDFWKCPTWLRTLARIPILEIFAYPIIVKKGFATIWIPENYIFETQKFESKGWNIRVGDPDEAARFLEGSLARLSTKSTSLHRPRITFTRCGREVAWQGAVHKANGTSDFLRRSRNSFKEN